MMVNSSYVMVNMIVVSDMRQYHSSNQVPYCLTHKMNRIISETIELIKLLIACVSSFIILGPRLLFRSQLKDVQFTARLPHDLQVISSLKLLQRRVFVHCKERSDSLDHDHTVLWKIPSFHKRNEAIFQSQRSQVGYVCQALSQIRAKIKHPGPAVSSAVPVGVSKHSN